MENREAPRHEWAQHLSQACALGEGEQNQLPYTSCLSYPQEKVHAAPQIWKKPHLTSTGLRFLQWLWWELLELSKYERLRFHACWWTGHRVWVDRGSPRWPLNALGRQVGIRESDTPSQINFVISVVWEINICLLLRQSLLWVRTASEIQDFSKTWCCHVNTWLCKRVLQKGRREVSQVVSSLSWNGL